MEALIQYIVSKLVVDPDSVEVVETRDGDEVHVQVYINPDDMGRVIGRQGKIARSIRSIAKAIGTKEQVMVSVDFDAKEE
ncbi:KH domain-containing protein [Aedoeadaptatus pacaensis]|uniref:KH domain-containing protein n=1 Tax=Aedoeadaptatus pacaensis TaxID=1776390 RepID=UPI00083802D3|nr:KH domain-containing protein [Peptoniphilus pacaensis]